MFAVVDGKTRGEGETANQPLWLPASAATVFWNAIRKVLLGSLLTLLSLLIFINPIRQRVSILATMFLFFDCPEDNP
ncbi:MAG: hypothetical protein WAW61_15140 [Methylococcaceae bacterium]